MNHYVAKLPVKKIFSKAKKKKKHEESKKWKKDKDLEWKDIFEWAKAKEGSNKKIQSQIPLSLHFPLLQLPWQLSNFLLFPKP